MSILTYKLEDLPDDILDALTTELSADLFAIVLCSAIYYGGSIFWIYAAIMKLHHIPLVGIWVLTAFANLIFIVPFEMRGICYMDRGRDHKVLITAFLGPIGTFRLIALVLFYALRIGNPKLLTIPVENWQFINSWAEYFKHEATKERPKVKYHERIRRILTKRIEII